MNLYTFLKEKRVIFHLGKIIYNCDIFYII